MFLYVQARMPVGYLGDGTISGLGHYRDHQNPQSLRNEWDEGLDHSCHRFGIEIRRCISVSVYRRRASQKRKAERMVTQKGSIVSRVKYAEPWFRRGISYLAAANETGTESTLFRDVGERPRALHRTKFNRERRHGTGSVPETERGFACFQPNSAVVSASHT